MRGPRPTILLPLVLLAASLALSSGQTCVEKNKIFQKHHVDSQPVRLEPGPYCNRMMRQRQIYGKRLNTFIQALIPNINYICSAGGIPSTGGLRKSKTNFRTTTCRYNPRTRSYTGRGMSKKIVIRCCGALPVYYQE